MMRRHFTETQFHRNAEGVENHKVPENIWGIALPLLFTHDVLFQIHLDINVIKHNPTQPIKPKSKPAYKNISWYHQAIQSYSLARLVSLDSLES